MKGINRVSMRKTLCRLTGPQTGGVMMEYVILAVLIAAAVVVAVAMFGKTLVGMFDTAGKGATGSEQSARNARAQTLGIQNTEANKARDYHDSLHEPETPRPPQPPPPPPRRRRGWK